MRDLAHTLAAGESRHLSAARVMPLWNEVPNAVSNNSGVELSNT